jgi:hypothetical protein
MAPAAAGSQLHTGGGTGRLSSIEHNDTERPIQESRIT